MYFGDCIKRKNYIGSILPDLYNANWGSSSLPFIIALVCGEFILIHLKVGLLSRECLDYLR